MSVIIVGGGMAGATLALAISRLSHGALPVHLIEATAPESHAHPGFDGRAIALAAGTCQQLARIGVWQSLADYATAITTVHVSDRGHAGFVTLAAEDYQLAALGQVVELHNVGQRLFALLRKAPGVTLHCPDRVTACGVDWQQEPYEQLAVIANVATSVAHEGRAFERFTQHGPLAMLPMSDGRCSLVWCHPLERREEVLSWSDEKFCRELQSAFGWRLGKITHAGKRSAYPLALTRAARAITHRTVLVGNAAQTLHPIAGQGFNLGMRDVMSLAETLTQAHERGEDIGDYGILCRYQQRRQSDREATIGVTDSLVHLFANRWAPLVVGRNIGLMTMELFTPARDVLAQRTLGWVAR